MTSGRKGWSVGPSDGAPVAYLNQQKIFAKEGRKFRMPGVVVREDEPFENALRRFKKQVQKSGILTETKKRRAYEKPSVKRKRKAMAARKRLLKKLRRMKNKY